MRKASFAAWTSVVLAGVAVLASCSPTTTTPATAPAASSVAATALAGPGDWPQWRGGPDRTNVSPETGLLGDWPEGGPPLLWTAKGLGGGYAPPSVQGRRLYALGRDVEQEFAFALDRDTGGQLWVAALWPAARDHAAMPWLGQRQPTADGERLYVTSAAGDLACLESATGRVLWRKSYLDDFKGKRSVWGYCDYPLVDGERLVCVPGGTLATVVALDKRTGELLWRSAVPGTSTPSQSSLVVAEIGGVRQYVYHFMEGLAAVSADDGKPLWSGVFRGITASVYSPIVRGDLVFCASGYGAGCALIRVVPPSAGGGGGEWKAEPVYERRDTVRRTTTRPATDMVTNAATNPATNSTTRPGFTPAQRVTFQTWAGSTVLIGEHVYAGVQSGRLTCFKMISGETAWQQQPGQAFGGGLVATLWAEGRLYCRYTDGTVALAEVTPRGGELRGRFLLPESVRQTASPPPIIAGGRMYLRDQGALHCYDITREGRWRTFASTRPVVLTAASGPAATRPRRPGEPDAVFVPTPQEVVDKMLELAGVGRGDVVYDLGSGDGRVVIAAATKFGARGVGVEIDADLVAASRENVKRAGVEDRVTIRQGDLFAAEFGDATVVTLYLLPELNVRLLPMLRRLRPGTRIVSHQFPIAGVEPARVLRYKPPGETEPRAGAEEHTLYLWVTPFEEAKAKP